MCDKSNAMTHAGGLWQRVFKEVSGEYPQITAQHMYVDALCMQMVRDPRQFDVIVTNNMFGDIITDLAAGLQGGLGMAASGNIHPGRTSMFEPVHGSAPPIAGKNMANPFGAILTAAMMLRHLGITKEAEKIEAAVLEAVRQKKTTQDIGGTLGTREAGEWVARDQLQLCHPGRYLLACMVRAANSSLSDPPGLSMRFGCTVVPPAAPVPATSTHNPHPANPISRNHPSCVSTSKACSTDLQSRP